MSNGHKTSAIARPRRRPGDPASGDHTRLSDFTRPIAHGKQLVQRKGNRWTLALLALVVIAALLGALFVLPVQAWLRQEDDLTAKRAQLAVLDNANSQLETEVDRLRTDEGAKEAARDELGLVAPGEIRISMLDVPAAPLTLPAGFPYDAVTQIVATRAEQSQPPPSPSPSPAPPSPSPPASSAVTTPPTASATTPEATAAPPATEVPTSTLP
jgi:cell division protein FtsB